MKLKFLAIALFPLTLAACQTTDLQKAGDLAVSVLQQQNASKTLSSYQWSTNTGSEKPLVLNFLSNGTLGISTSCNNLSTSWKAENNTIVTGNMAATMMACPQDRMQQEGIASQIFDGGKTAFLFNLNDINAPTLTLTAKNGKQYVFTGKMTPETKYQTQAETIFLEISPETKQCTGVARQTCLQVREIKYAENGIKTQVDKDWTLFYDQIEGFQHSPNERQIIRIKRYELKNPAADQSKYAYIYDMAVEREAVKGTL